MRRKVRQIDGLTPLEWLRRALPEVAASGLSDLHKRVLRDRHASRALKAPLQKLRVELAHDPRDEDQLRAVDRIASEIGMRSGRRRRRPKDPANAALQADSSPPPSLGAPATARDSGLEPLDAVLAAIGSVPLRTAWEWFRQGMQLANMLSSPERGRAAAAAGKSLAQDTVAALGKFGGSGSSNWVLGAQVVADLESRLGALALRDTRESCDPLTPLDVGQAILEAIAGRAEQRQEGSRAVGIPGGQRMRGVPLGDEKCLRCGHDPESCYGAFADEEA